jgi:hypothetical protein
MQNPRQEESSVETLRYICQAVLRNFSPIFQNASITACFYPYIGLTHTIRRKGTEWTIRISDHCRNAPRSVLESIVTILACKIVHKKPRLKYRNAYEFFRKSPSVVEAVRGRRLSKGRKHIDGNEGRYHSLRKICLEMNSRYFNNQIDIVRIGWGFRRSWNRLGHYDPVHHTVTLSPVLDSPNVPDFVVRYVVYHEMLHSIFEDSSDGRAHKHHHREFRQAEKAYPDFLEAKKFLAKYCRRK